MMYGKAGKSKGMSKGGKNMPPAMMKKMMMKKKMGKKK